MEQRPELTSDEVYRGLRGFLENRNEAFQAAYHRDDTNRITDRLAQLRSLGPKTVNSVLDVGAGDGRVVAGLAASYGIPKEKAFGTEVATYENGAPISWLTYGPKGEIPLPDSSIDLATILMVLHHTEDPAAVIRETARVLKPGATLIVRETDAKNPEEVLFNRCMDTMFYKVFSNGSNVPLPYNYRSAGNWAKLFQKEGFEIVERTPTDTANPFSPTFFVMKKK